MIIPEIEGRRVVPNRKPWSGFQFQHELSLTLDTVREKNPNKLPDFLAHLVLRMPTTVKEWNNIGVNPSNKGNFYHSTVLAVFGRLATDSEVTSRFFERLSNFDNIISQRFDSELLEGVAVTSLSTPEFDPEAVATIVEWSQKRLDARSYRGPGIFGRSRLDNKFLAELSALVERLRVHSQDILADDIDFIVKTRIDMQVQVRR